MIIYQTKDVSTVERGIVAHGVNCQGVMGSGVAAALRRKYPQIYHVYKLICDMYTKNPDWMLGMIDVVDVKSEHEDELLIVNCFTQEHYGRDGKKYANAAAVESSINSCLVLAQGLGLPFYMPQIGCGLGGLSWETEIEPIVAALSDKHKIDVHVCTL